MSKQHIRLTEKYRPQSYADVIGQSKAIAVCQRLGAGGRAYWITGQSGTGKTTLAKILAKEVAHTSCIYEWNGKRVGINDIRFIEEQFHQYSLFEDSGYAFIIDESHYLRNDIIGSFLTLLENIPDHITIIFTTTNEGQDRLFDDSSIEKNTFLSRCAKLSLARRDLTKPFAERARQIAVQENLDGRPMKAYVELVRQNRNNLRAVIQHIDDGGMLP